MRHKTTSFDKYSQLKAFGSAHDLSFSSHLALGDRIIALDGLKRKLLVAEITSQASQTFIIDLDEVRSVAIKKTYRSIKPGELDKKGLGQFLQSIDLIFEYPTADKTVALPFYNGEKDKFGDLSKLERNARNWQMILSKLVNMQSNTFLQAQRQLQLAV